MALLSTEEAKYFIQNILQLKNVPELPIQNLPDDGKLNFIHSILSRYLETEPFQSITLMAVDLDKRRRPTWQEIKTDMFACRGGLCYSQNAFMFALLTAIGLDVSMTRGTCVNPTNQHNNHLCLLLHGLFSPNNTFLADLAMGYAMPRVISLDFETESPEYTDSFQTYKFVKDGDTVVFKGKTKKSIRAGDIQTADVQMEGDENADADDKLSSAREWKTRYHFTLSDLHKELETLDSDFDIIYTDVTKLVFHSSPRSMHWPGGRFFAIIELEFITENSTRTLVKTNISQNLPDDVKPRVHSVDFACPAETGNDVDNLMERLVAMYAKYFPQFESWEVRAAVENWKKIRNFSGTNLHDLDQLLTVHVYKNIATEN
ncbi:arylamine N-acetyltransferase 1 [Biomphalaria glabrata]|nr:arylamine N-acetyltransferase 1 [Biomphalaria glabrata]